MADGSFTGLSDRADHVRAARPTATAVVHPLVPPAAVNAPVCEPIYQSSAWSFDSLAQAEAVFSGVAVGIPHRAYGSPNHRLLESLLAELEQAESCVTTAGGMSALAAVFWTLLEPGARVIASHDLFGVTAALLGDMQRWGVTTTYVDATDVGVVADALRQSARLVLIESISNPRMRVPDIERLARLAHDHGALLIVDNTLAGPYHCRPITFGADMVVEAATTALAGHHDVVLGAVAGTAAMITPMRSLVERSGLGPGAFDVWLARRGTMSYALRQERASANAAQLADWLAARDAIQAVHYPGRTDHPDHEVARRMLTSGYGSMLSLEIDTSHLDVDTFLAALEHIRLVHSLGGAATSLSHAVTMTHRCAGEDRRRELGLHWGFFRMSVGIESIADVISELERALHDAASTER